MTDKRDKKLLKDLAYSVQHPLALGIKQLTTSNPSRASRYTKAVLLRAKKPRTTTLQQILRNDNLLHWDHPLLTVTIKEMMQVQANLFRSQNQLDLANKMINDMKDLLVMLAEDQFILTPDAIYGAINALLAADPSMATITENYRIRRNELAGDHVNVQQSLHRITGACIGYNFKFRGCENNTCSYEHCCLLHSDKQYHKTMECPDNPNKWKKRNDNNWNYGNYNKRRNRGSKYKRNYYQFSNYNNQRNPYLPHFIPNNFNNNNNNNGSK